MNTYDAMTNDSLAQLRTAIRRVLDYLYDEEKAHFEGCGAAEREGHIFPELHCLRTWLEEECNDEPTQCGS